MSPSQPLSTLAATLSAAVFLVTLVTISEPAASQDGKAGAAGPTCKCPNSEQSQERPWPRPKYADLKPILDDNDEIAALEAVQVALSEVSDGSTFVWHRANGRLSGQFQPTSSFRDVDGKICRHLRLKLSAGPFSKSTEGIACRAASGIWMLEG